MAKTKRQIRTLLERFEEKFSIDPVTKCWNWIAAIKVAGYGGIQVNDRTKTQLAHRVAYELYIGPIPPGDGYHGTCVCHRCDNRLCVNPAHLFLGSAKENMHDMVSKNRDKHPFGEDHGRAKLTIKAVHELRILYESGTLNIPQQAARLNVTKTAIRLAAQRKTWRKV